MKYNWFCILLFPFIISCASKKDSDGEKAKITLTERDSIAAIYNGDSAMAQITEGSAEEDSVKLHTDSFRVYCAAMMKAKINLPPVYQREIFEANNEATDKFSKLSKACNGRMKVLMSSGEVVKEMETTIKGVSVQESDLLILLDRTGSMTDDIEYVKRGIHDIIDTVKKYKGTRLAIATYGDKNWDWKDSWYTIKNFETDYDAAAGYVNRVECISNADWPESVYDAVVKSMESDFWKSTKKRNIILVGDAPPQEKPMSDYSLSDVIDKAKQMKVKMNFYPILIMPEIHQVKLSQEDKDKYQEIRNNTKLYPNPSKGIINLSMEQTATYYLEMYDVNGNVVLNEEYYGIFWTKDISNLPNGVYIMRVINADHSFEVIKFILQH